MMINDMLRGLFFLRVEAAADGGDSGGGGDAAVTPALGSNAGDGGATDVPGAVPGLDGLPDASGSEPAFTGYPDSPDKMAEYLQAHGIPDKAEEYDFQLDEGVALDEDVKGFLKEAGVKYGLHPKAMEGLVRDWLGRESGLLAQRQQAVEEGFRDLAKSWGADYDAKVQNAEVAFTRVAAIAGLDVEDFPLEFRNSAAGFKLMSVVSDLMSEGRAKGTGAQVFRSSADEARRMESDPTHPLYEAYMDFNHPNHQYANELYDRYMGLGG